MKKKMETLSERLEVFYKTADFSSSDSIKEYDPVVCHKGTITSDSAKSHRVPISEFT